MVAKLILSIGNPSSAAFFVVGPVWNMEEIAKFSGKANRQIHCSTLEKAR